MFLHAQFSASAEYFNRCVFVKTINELRMVWRMRKYKKYEKYHLENHIDEIVPESNKPPEGVMFRPQFA